MKKILVVSDDVKYEGFRASLNLQFWKEINLKKTQLIFTDFNAAFGLLEKDPDIGVCAVDLTKFDLMPAYRVTDPEQDDPHLGEWQHPAVNLLRAIRCKFRHKKIVIGFWHNRFNEHNIMIFIHKPDIICRADDLRYKLNRYLIDKYDWIRWDLREPRPLPQNTVQI